MKLGIAQTAKLTVVYKVDLTQDSLLDNTFQEKLTELILGERAQSIRILMRSTPFTSEQPKKYKVNELHPLFMAFSVMDFFRIHSLSNFLKKAHGRKFDKEWILKKARGRKFNKKWMQFVDCIVYYSLGNYYLELSKKYDLWIIFWTIYIIRFGSQV